MCIRDRTGIVQKPSISSVKAAPSSDASSAKVTFHVDALFPVSQVNASLNEKDIDVDVLGNQDYSLEVEENGYLLLDVVSISGLHATQEISIDSIAVSYTHLDVYKRQGLLRSS